MLIFFFVLILIISLYLHISKRYQYNIEYFNFGGDYDLDFLLQQKKIRPFPFRFFKSENNNILPVVAVTGFFRSDKDKKRYYDFIKGNIIVIGVSAYRTFPIPINDEPEDKYHLTDEFDYLKNIRTWLYCMKDPSLFNLNNQEHNLLEMSESDFYDVEETNLEIDDDIKYDFIYICNKDAENCPINGWNSIVRNYALALKCFPIMFNEYRLKGLLVGRIGCGLEDIYGSDVIETTDFLPYNELQKKMRQSRFLFLPNITDQSPRVISEMMIKNKPVLMNQNIICGFKYVNDQTGVFFNDENDFRTSLETMLLNLPYMEPKTWWKKNHSKSKNGQKLRDFLFNIYPDVFTNIREVSMFL